MKLINLPGTNDKLMWDIWISTDGDKFKCPGFTSSIHAGYIMLYIERLRNPMQMITDHILLKMGIKKSSPPLLFPSVNQTIA
jgi:hypothetical protein